MRFGRSGLIAVLLFVASSAHACLFATSTPPEGWYQWSKALFAGEVTAITRDKSVDTVTVRVVETFKGPDAAHGILTVSVPSRHWTTCKLEVPVAGASVLVAMNPNDDAMLVPLSDRFAEKLRAYRIRGQGKN